jgi:hypothetical protein
MKTNLSSFTRRDFIKLSAAGALGLLLAEIGLERVLAATAPPRNFGRVLYSGLNVYDSPTFGASHEKRFGKDQVIPLTAAIQGEAGNPFNHTWYQIGDQGYTYSGWVQPVETVYNKPDFDIPDSGRLAEITVPFSMVRQYPNARARTGFRLYYQTTHWVRNIVVDREQKSMWYEIYDYHLRESFYIPSYDARLIPDDELTHLSADVPEELKSILVDLSTQTVTLFEDQIPVLVSRSSTGAKGTRTPSGEFLTYHKGPSIHMTNQGDAIENIFDLPGVPWVTFFTGTGISFHGTYWHNDYGRPRSHGCVNLTSDEAKFIYRWTRPVVPPDVDYVHLPGQGTRVVVT